MLSQLKSLTLLGLHAEEIQIEVDLHKGLPSFQIVGLGDTAVQEARERVRSAIKNSGFHFPRTKIVVNLAPANLRKQGSGFDVAIALGILSATGQIDLPDMENTIFIGELAFTGDIRPISGVLPMASGAADMGYDEIFVPIENQKEASIIRDIKVYGMKDLKEIVEHLAGTKTIEIAPHTILEGENTEEIDTDMKHIKGQEHAKRALEIAAAGGHNMLMSGPPGSGKTMLAKSLATILPQITLDEAIEITKIHSIAHLVTEDNPIIFKRPFRSVHHTASGVAIIGGGNPPRPGEISLSHRGVLFLDEFAEFPQKTLEVLRQPLEDGVVTVSRASGSFLFPAQMMLVAAMNPCPCGYHGDPEKECHCTANLITRYQNRISGPLLDRIDLHVEVPRVEFEKIANIEVGEDSATIRQRVERAREIQRLRFIDTSAKTNAEMTSPMVKKYCHTDEASNQLLKSAVQQMNLSGRAYYRILKLARTIADLAGSENLEINHIAEAIGYRERKADF